MPIWLKELRLELIFFLYYLVLPISRLRFFGISDRVRITQAEIAGGWMQKKSTPYAYAMRVQFARSRSARLTLSAQEPRGPDHRAKVSLLVSPSTSAARGPCKLSFRRHDGLPASRWCRVLSFLDLLYPWWDVNEMETMSSNDPSQCGINFYIDVIFLSTRCKICIISPQNKIAEIILYIYRI